MIIDMMGLTWYLCTNLNWCHLPHRPVVNAINHMLKANQALLSSFRLLPFGGYNLQTQIFIYFP